MVGPFMNRVYLVCPLAILRAHVAPAGGAARVTPLHVSLLLRIFAAVRARSHTLRSRMLPLPADRFRVPSDPTRPLSPVGPDHLLRPALRRESAGGPVLSAHLDRICSRLAPRTSFVRYARR